MSILGHARTNTTKSLSKSLSNIACQKLLWNIDLVRNIQINSSSLLNDEIDNTCKINITDSLIDTVSGNYIFDFDLSIW